MTQFSREARRRSGSARPVREDASVPDPGPAQPERFPVPGVFMHTENAHKIDPRLRKKKAQTADAFVEVATSGAMEWLRTRPWVSGFVQIVDGYCSATVGIAHLDELARHPGIVEVEAVRSPPPPPDRSVRSVHGGGRMAKEKDRQAQGAGVVIGIIDYGLEFRLKGFRDSARQSRIP